MQLKDLFTSVPQREDSGSRASNRFEFQKDWGLCLLLDLHLKGEDYLVLFEFHEDIAVLNSPVNPTAAEFYQVKTKKKGNWTRGALLKRSNAKKAEAKSILGKLYTNKLRFPTHSAKLAVVSNAYFDLKLAPDRDSSKTLTTVKYLQIHSDDRKLIEAAIQNELSLKGEPEFEQLRLEVCDLHIESHSQHATGKLAEFLEKLKPEGKFAVPAIYRVLISEVRIKTDTEKTADDFGNMAKLKGISRDQFEGMLNQCGVKDDLRETWDKADATLGQAGVPAKRRFDLRTAFGRVEADRMSRFDRELAALRDIVHQRLLDVMTRQPEASLLSAAHTVSNELLTQIDAARFDRDYVTVLCMLDFYEAR